MGLIIFVVVVILAIYLIKKSSSDKNSSFEEPVKSQISFDNLSQRRRFLLLSAQNTSMEQNTNSIKTMWRNTRCLASQGKLFKLNDLMWLWQKIQTIKTEINYGVIWLDYNTGCSSFGMPSIALNLGGCWWDCLPVCSYLIYCRMGVRRLLDSASRWSFRFYCYFVSFRNRKWHWG